MTDRDPFRVTDARFLRSAPTLAACGEAPWPEVAFVGRSNVGKSSLLGELLARPKLVKTSRTPGRTRAVNLFEVCLRRASRERADERRLTFADLPGYGYAQASLVERRRMSELLSEYVSAREGLVAVVQLFDVRHAPTADDRAMLEGLRERDYVHVLVATKADKLPPTKRKAAGRALAKALGAGADDLVLFSTTEHFGRAAVWERVWEALS